MREGSDGQATVDGALTTVGEREGAIARAAPAEFALRHDYVPRWMRVVALLSALPYAVSVAAYGDAMPLAALLVAIAAPLGVTVAIARTRRFKPGTVTLDAEAIRFDGHTVASRAKVHQATVAPARDARNPKRATIQLGDANGLPLARFVADDEATAQAFVRALRLDVSNATASFTAQGVVSGWAAIATLGGLWAAGMTAFFAALVHAHFATWGLLVGAPIAALLMLGGLMLVSGSTVRVGSDGVVLRSVLGRQQIVRFSDLARVERVDDGVLLHKRDGSMLPVKIRAERAMPWATASIEHVREGLIARIEEAMRAPEGASLGLDEGALSPHDDDASRWLRGLRAIAQRAEGGMRSLPTLRAELLARLRDPRAEPTVRAGAAVVLAQLGDGRDRDELRAVARTIASPRLRVALEAAAAHDPAKVPSRVRVEPVEAEAPEVAAADASDRLEEALATLVRERSEARRG